MYETGNSRLQELLASLDKRPEVRGKQFELICKWWLENSRISPFAPRAVSKVWTWSEWPGRFGPDTGIDLVVRLDDETLAAVQCKCFSENTSIPKTELDSFVSAASPREFSHRLLIATTDLFSRNAKRMLDTQKVIRINRSVLEDSLVEWPTSLSDLHASPTHSIATPMNHQREAISAVLNQPSQWSRGQLVMACGTGKTLTALWISDRVEPQLCLVLLPSLGLLAQTVSEWRRHSATEWRFMAVCSDESVSRSEDATQTTVGDLPFVVTTTPKDICDFLSEPGRKVIFSTYQSSIRVSEALKKSAARIDLAICDEAHRLAGFPDSEYSCVLHDEWIPCEKRLFMTATPRVFGAGSKASAESKGIAISSMDNEDVFGPVLYRLSFGQAIESELLSDYRVVIVGVTDQEIEKMIHERRFVQSQDFSISDARTIATHIGLIKATKQFSLNKVISFHSRVTSAASFAANHPRVDRWLATIDEATVGSIWTQSISGKMPTFQRRQILKRLGTTGDGTFALVTNAQCLSEGIDVPALNGVAFVDPRTSQVDIVQAVGRAIRKSKDKSVGTIVLPVFIPEQDVLEDALAESSFRHLWAVINALKAHDSRLETELSQLREKLGRSGGRVGLPSRISIDISGDITEVREKFVSALELWTLEQTTRSFEFWFGLLKSVEDRQGHVLVTSDHLERGFRLGQWIGTQRSDYASGILKDERRSRLETLRGWSWNILEDQWEHGFSKLEEFLETHGHACLPRYGIAGDGFDLGQWGQVQRSRYKNGKLRSDRIERLEKLLGWSWNLVLSNWFKKYEMLVQHGAKAGSYFEIPDIHINDFEPAKWASLQRARRNELGPQQIRALESLKDWSWSPRDDRFNSYFEILKRWVAITGHSRVPHKLEFENTKIGFFVLRCRQDYKNGRLSNEQIALLEDLAGWTWDVRSTLNQSMIDALQLFTTNNSGDLPPTGFKVEGKSLRGWINGQRLKYRDGTIDPSLKRELESIPNWNWSPKESREGPALFAARVKAVLEYRAEFGHCLIPDAYKTPTGIPLGTWVSRMRQMFKKGTLPASQVAELTEIDGWQWSAPRRARDEANIRDKVSVRWDVMYQLLSEYLRQSNSGNLTTHTVYKQKRLGRWVARQRRSYKNGVMSSERIQALENLPRWRWSSDEDSSIPTDQTTDV